MNPIDIEQLLMSLPKPSLSPERDRRIREAILAAPSPTPPERVRWSFTVPRFAFAFAGILVAVVGVGGYVYAAPTVTRGDALYVVKRSIEQVHALLPRAPVEQVWFHTTLAFRRAAEIEVLVGERGSAGRFAFVSVAHAAADDSALNGDDPVSATVADLIAETAAAVRVAETITEAATARRAVEVLAKGQERVQERLVRAARTVGVANPKRAEVLARAMATVQETSVASRAAAAETAIAVERGDRNVRVMITSNRELKRAPSDAEELAQELSDERSELLAFRSTLADAGVAQSDADALVGQIEEKLDRADVAIRAGKERQASGALNAAEVLRKNAKHFVKTVEHDAAERGETEDALAAVHSELEELASRIEILQDLQPEHRLVRAATALLETARAKLAEASAAFAVGADELARTQAEVAAELLERLEDRLGGWEEEEEPESAEEDVLPPDDVREMSRPRPSDEDDVNDVPSPEPAGGPAEDVERPPKFDARRDVVPEFKREARERTERRERVRGKVEEWSNANGAPPAIDPETNIRYEFKGEYLRPLAW